MRATQRARIAKTQRFYDDRAGFLAELCRDIEALIRKAAREGLSPAVRLNGTSDLPWETYRTDDGRTLMDRFPSVTFYDYTKSLTRVRRFAAGKLPPNYHLTFSRAETKTNHAASEAALALGVTVSVVFDAAPPATYQGVEVVNGDDHDARMLDAPGVYLGLTAKGAARHDASGFVIHA